MLVYLEWKPKHHNSSLICLSSHLFIQLYDFFFILLVWILVIWIIRHIFFGGISYMRSYGSIFVNFIEYQYHVKMNFIQNHITAIMTIFYFSHRIFSFSHFSSLFHRHIFLNSHLFSILFSLGRVHSVNPCNFTVDFSTWIFVFPREENSRSKKNPRKITFPKKPK